MLKISTKKIFFLYYLTSRTGTSIDQVHSLQWTNNKIIIVIIKKINKKSIFKIFNNKYFMWYLLKTQ